MNPIYPVVNGEPTLTQVCTRFAAAWLRGEEPQLDNFLGANPQLPALLELARLDLMFRLKAGQDVGVETYLRRYPALAKHEDAVVALIEHAHAAPGGPAEDGLAECVRRFPQYAEALRRQLTSAASVADGPRTTVLAPGELPEKLPKWLRPVPDGQQVGSYQILGELGRGGMGVVYKARHVALNRVVALKMILSGEHASAKDLTRFKSEAEAVARLHHPNIVQIYEIGAHQGRPYFALEFVDGGSLADQLAGKPIPARQAAQLTATLAPAIHYAHRQNVIHRDLKPANILLQIADCRLQIENTQSEGASAPFGKSAICNLQSAIPKITDFGLAKQLDSDVTRQTRSGVVVGTPSYMAPEQAMGRHEEFGPTIDVYALGVILFEMLTGRPPFLGETAMDTLVQVANEDPVPPRRLQPKVPRDLETICLKCLQKQPRRRYATGQLLADDLQRFLAGEPILARRVSVFERACKWARRHWAATAVWSAGLVLTLVVLFGSLLYLRKERQHAEDVRGLILRARQAVDIEAYGNARELVNAAEALIRESALTDVAADPELEQVRARLAARDTIVHFEKQRDDAIFQATLSFGAGAAKKLQLTQTKARQALAGVGLTVPANQPWTPPASFTEREQQDVRQSAYELLMVLADAVAQPLPGQTPDEQRSNAEQAVRILDQAADLGVQTHAYHLRRAHCLEQAGRLAAAQEQEEEAKKRQPVSAVDFFLLGTELHREGKAKAAVDEFREALRLQPTHFWARYYLALSLMQLDRYEPARDNLTSCLSAQPKLPWIYLMRGFVLGQLKEYAIAEADFARALELLKSDPNLDAEYALYNNRGVVLTNRERFADAIRDFEKAIALKPRQYQAYVSLSQVFVQRKPNDLNEALRHLDQGIAVAREQDKTREIERPTLALLYRQRAQLHEDRRQYDEAIGDLEQASRFETAGPARARILSERGRLLQQRQRYAEAVAAYDAALELVPAQADPHRRRAESLYRLERYAEAVAGFNRYLQQGGKHSAKVYQTRAAAKGKLGDHQGAANDYTLALELEPAQPALYVARGQALLSCQAYALALADFEEALRRAPENGPAHNGRGFARVKLGKYKEAVADADEAVRQGPATHQLFYNAARIYAQAVACIDAEPKAERQLLELRRRYQDRAVELVSRALQQLPAGEHEVFWRNTVSRDGAFVPIRRHPGFQRLAERYLAAPAKQ